MEEKKKITTIDEYISTFPADVQEKLEQVRKVIHEVAPDAKEAISYQMPTFKLNGNLIHFAGHKEHIGIYPMPEVIDNFKDDLAKYKTSKGAIQLPLDEPMPIDLIKRIVLFRMDLMKNKKRG